MNCMAPGCPRAAAAKRNPGGSPSRYCSQTCKNRVAKQLARRRETSEQRELRLARARAHWKLHPRSRSPQNLARTAEYKRSDAYKAKQREYRAGKGRANLLLRRTSSQGRAQAARYNARYHATPKGLKSRRESVRRYLATPKGRQMAARNNSKPARVRQIATYRKSRAAADAHARYRYGWNLPAWLMDAIWMARLFRRATTAKRAA